MTLVAHIEQSPGIVGGKPRISRRRISVQDIVIWHERMGLEADQIAAEHDLSLADIHAALAYYFDHRLEIDQSIRQSKGFVESMRSRIPSKLPILCHAAGS